MLALTPGQSKYSSWLKAKTNTPATFIIGGLCGLVIGYIVFSSDLALAPTKDNEDLASQNKATTNFSASPSAVAKQSGFRTSLNNQLPGSVVFVKHVEMEESGWLAVHIDQNGAFGPIILGASYFKMGSDDNVIISLLKRTEDGNNYWLVEHADNGDHIFDSRSDLPRRAKNGNMEAIKFSVVAESSRGD